MATTAEYRKEYYYANREKCLAAAKDYRERNKEKIRAASVTSVKAATMTVALQ